MSDRDSGCAVALIVLVQLILLAINSELQSPSLNEPAHLFSGISNLDLASFQIYKVNPPLIRMVAAVPAVSVRHAEIWPGYNKEIGRRLEFELGEGLVRSSGPHFAYQLFLARLACIPFCLLGGWICFLWARDLFGPSAGLFALALWCFSPMVIGMGATIAPDAHAAALGIAACYTFWRWLKSPTWTQTVLTGVVLGLAELSKTTFIVFYPIWPVIWVLYRIGERRRSNSGLSWPRFRFVEVVQVDRGFVFALPCHLSIIGLIVQLAWPKSVDFCAGFTLKPLNCCNRLQFARFGAHRSDQLR